jgi:methylenetetrahydrofolate reductase (NADPH)
MKIVSAFSSPRKTISFEFFPPKDDAGVVALFQTLGDLVAYRPDFVSVTYGAMGSTRGLTVELVRRIHRELGLLAMAHLTCVGSSKEELLGVLSELREAGVENVLALRGDPPQGDASFFEAHGGFKHADELVHFIKGNGFSFCLGGACYPETHPEATSAASDLEHLKRKVDSGVDFLITQLFFDNVDYFRFRERLERAQIRVPVVAGLMPVTNVAQVKRFTQLCGARVPDDLLRRLEACEDDRAKVRAIGVEHTTKQAEGLLREGAPGLHFYTLNRSLATREILENLRASGAVPA